jgi:hypothetical protein
VPLADLSRGKVSAFTASAVAAAFEPLAVWLREEHATIPETIVRDALLHIEQQKLRAQTPANGRLHVAARSARRCKPQELRNLALLLTAAGSPTDLGRHVALTALQLANIATGKWAFEMAYQFKICRALDLPSDWFEQDIRGVSELPVQTMLRLRSV